MIAIAPPAIAITTSISRRGRPCPLPGGVTNDMINVPTHAKHTTAPINRNAIVRLLGKRHATAIIAGNSEVLPITIQVSGGVCRKSIRAEKASRTTAKTKQSQPAISGKILRDVFNSKTPKVKRSMFLALYSIKRTVAVTGRRREIVHFKTARLRRSGSRHCYRAFQVSMRKRRPASLISQMPRGLSFFSNPSRAIEFRAH